MERASFVPSHRAHDGTLLTFRTACDNMRTGVKEYIFETQRGELRSFDATEVTAGKVVSLND